MLNMTALLDDAFSVVNLTSALSNVPYQPRFLATLGLFDDKPINTAMVAIEKDGSTLKLIPSTPRGAPLPVRSRDPRTIRGFPTIRIAAGDRVNASELFGVRAFGTEDQLQTVASEILRRQNELRNDWELTMEYQRLGAIMGKVYDADGTTLITDWFAEWGITPDAEIDFNLDVDAAGQIRVLLSQLIRAMDVDSDGAWTVGSRVGALVGDAFYDALISNKEVRETYLNQQEASQLRGPIVPFESFTYGGVTFYNYRGATGVSGVSINTDKAYFFPIGVPGMFQRALSPGERLQDIGTMGQEIYAMQIPDTERDMWVDLEVYSYPLHIVTRPKMLKTGRRT